MINKFLANTPKIFIPFLLKCGKIFLSPHSQVVLHWKLIDGDNTIWINHHLKKNSIVFDLGGYEGMWSEAILKKYHCTIYIFEPVKEYVEKIEVRFRGSENVKVFPYGLSGRKRNIYLHMSDNETSEFGKSGKLVKSKVVSIKQFINDYEIKQVDLIKINIEGGEYELLEYLLEAGLIKRFNNIQVQFHAFVPNAELRASKIQNELKETHSLSYQFPFVWEKWTLNKLNKHKRSEKGH